MASWKVVPVDATCLKCGYALRGLKSSGNCPECGTSINESLRGPQWTPFTGLRNAVLYEFRWGAFCFVLLVATFVLAAPVINWLAEAYWGAMITVVSLAVPVIWLLWHRVLDAAGFLSAVLGVVAFIATCVVVSASAIFSCLFGPLDPAAAIELTIGIPLVTGLWITYSLWAD